MIQCEEIKAWFRDAVGGASLARPLWEPFEITHPAVQKIARSVSSMARGSILGKLFVNNPSVSKIGQECCGHVEMMLTTCSSRRYPG